MSGAAQPTYGHFGAPSLHAAVALGTALVAHLLVPFGYIEYRGFAPPDGKLLWLKGAADLMDQAPSYIQPLNQNLWVLGAGLIVGGAGAAMLMVMGQQPLRVDAARWIGCSGGLLVALGGALALMTSMYYVGTGFATFMGTVTFTEFRSQYWAISPVIVAAASAYAIHCGLRVMVRVTTSHDGIRAKAAAHAEGARRSAVLLLVIILVPWAVGLLPDGISDEVGHPIPGDTRAPLFFSLQDVQGATLGELAPGGDLRFASEQDWTLLKIGLTVLLGLAWSAFVAGLIGTAIGTVRSVGGGEGWDQFGRVLMAPVGLFWIAGLVFFLISWFAVKPRDDPGGTFLPGFLNIVGVSVAMMYLLAAQRRIVQDGDDVPAANSTVA